MAPSTPPLQRSDAPMLRELYTEFWSRLLPEFVNVGGIEPSPDKVFWVDVPNPNPQTGSLQIRTPRGRALSLRKLQMYPTGKKRDLCDAFIQFQHVVRRVARSLACPSGLEILSSNVRVSYVRSYGDPDRTDPDGSGTRQVLNGFHFDMAYDPHRVFQAAHPIFHVQLDFGAVDKEAIGYPCKETERSIRCEFPRVPTPPMDLPSVVFLVLADHMGKNLTGWPRSVEGAVKNLPRLPDWPVTKATEGKGQLEITSWYGDPVNPPKRPAS